MSDSTFSQADVIRKCREQLEQLTPLVTVQVRIPDTDVVLNVTRPADIDALLDDTIDDPEQNLPYWAEIWPSGIALASLLYCDPGLVRGLPVLELGSGIGITAAAAIACGAKLTVTDYSHHSLLLTQLTCLQAGLDKPQVRQVNWRDPDAHLLQEGGQRWPVVLAADVLYEERDINPVLEVLERILAPGGIVLLAEPGRRPARLALERASERGWLFESTTCSGPWPDIKDDGVIVSIHHLFRD